MEIRLVDDNMNARPSLPTGPYDWAGQQNPAPAPAVDIPLLIRRYWLVVAGLMFLGGACGFVSVVLSWPMYRAYLTLEIRGINEALLKNSLDRTSLESNHENVQTQINILRSGTF